MLRVIFGFLILSSAGCATQQGSFVSEEIIIISPNTSKIARAFPQIRKSTVIYKESYTGNSTLYYSPIQIDYQFVNVPEVSCHSYTRDDIEKYNHNKCYFKTSRRYYAKNPRYFFDLGENISISDAKEAAFAWYEHNKADGHYIDYIDTYDGKFRIWISGGACSSSVIAIKNNSDEYIFNHEESEVVVCS